MFSSLSAQVRYELGCFSETYRKIQGAGATEWMTRKVSIACTLQTAP